MSRLAIAVLLAGCFNPNLGDEPFKCGVKDACPPDYTCVSGICTRQGEVTADAPAGTPDGRPRPDGAPGSADAPSGRPDAGCVATCNGDDLMTCNGPTVHCAAGCDSTQVPGACLILAPIGLTEVCRDPGTVDFTISPTIDTNACTGGTVVPQVVGPDRCVYKFANVMVPNGANVRWTGDRVPVIVATGTAKIGGQLFVNGRASTPGPGTAALSVGNGASAGAGDSGGGGGHATSGGAGAVLMGSDRPTPGGGSAYPMAYNGVLAPGGNGGNGGGGGGGAIGLIACGRLLLDATLIIDAAGGGGEAGAAGPTVVGGSGGGAGGTIRIEAAEIVFTSGAVLVANGGGGGGGGGGVNVGTTNPPGDDGHLDGSVARGSGGVTGAGAGGAGGTSDGVTGAAPMDGTSNTIATAGAGGGGGAAGVIVFQTRADKPPNVPSGVVISPAPKLGQVARQR